MGLCSATSKERCLAMSCNVIRLDLYEDNIIKCEIEGITLEVKRGSVVGKMARYLVELGHALDSTVVVYRENTICFLPMTLSAWAMAQVSENDSGFRFVKYKPFRGFDDE